MTNNWRDRFAHFEGAPVVDVFGVLEGRGWGGWSALEGTYPHQPDDLGLTRLTFEVWRVGDGEPNIARRFVSAVLSRKDWNSLAGPHTWSRFAPVVHIKARVAMHPQGFEDVLLEEWVGPISDDAELNEIYRQLNQAVILDSPPLPRLQLSQEGAWLGTISLPLWESFYLKSGYGGGRGGGLRLSMSSVEMPAVRLGYKGVPPTPEQIAAYVYLTENEKAGQDAVLQAILDNYAQWQENYGIDEEYMPLVISPEQFQSLLLLWDVSISFEAKEGFAYVLLNLLPQWDIEHGMGAILHRDRVVAVGDHDSIWDAIERNQEV